MPINPLIPVRKTTLSRTQTGNALETQDTGLLMGAVDESISVAAPLDATDESKGSIDVLLLRLASVERLSDDLPVLHEQRRPEVWSDTRLP